MVILGRGHKGGGILRDIKPLVMQGVHKKYFARNLMTKYYLDRFLQKLLEVDLGEDEEAGDGETQQPQIRYTKFRTYSNLQKIKDDIENGESVSVVACADGSICLLFYDNKEHRMCVL